MLPLFVLYINKLQIVEVHVISSIPWNFLMNFCEMIKENFEMLKEIVV